MVKLRITIILSDSIILELTIESITMTELASFNVASTFPCMNIDTAMGFYWIFTVYTTNCITPRIDVMNTVMSTNLSCILRLNTQKEYNSHDNSIHFYLKDMYSIR